MGILIFNFKRDGQIVLVEVIHTHQQYTGLPTYFFFTTSVCYQSFFSFLNFGQYVK